MAWLDDRLRDHPKIIRASAPAFRHWALALCYCSAHGTAGRLDEAIVALNVPKKVIDELVKLKLWDREPDGLWVHDWQEHNSKRDENVDERRRQARERQQRHRARARGEETSDDPQHAQASPPSVTRDTHRDVTRDVTRDEQRDTARDTLAGARPRRARDHDQELPKKDLAAAAPPERDTPEPNLRDAQADAAAAETIERLQALGIDPTTVTSLEHAAAWLDLAEHEAQRNPAGFVITGLATGQPPSPRVDTPAAEPSLLDKARGLYERTRDPERVADWLAGLPRLSPTERDHLLEQATT